LKPSCAPGGNFDLTKFKLQLPTGTSNKPDSIDGSKLAGCSGYTDKSVFHTNKADGALVLKVCGSSSSCGCVTTKNSKHCRTELRESKPASWSPHASVNRLRASLKVVKADDSPHGTVVGQIHVDEEVSKKPVCELFVDQKGVVTMGVEQIPDEASLKYTKVGKVKIGEKWDYEIRYEKGALSVSINGGAMKKLSTGQLTGPASYFKAGNYNQGDSESEVHFYIIDIQH
ncbi:alginate lyase 2, partial [Bimuria novae-zelandiae CBS 107.79]